MTSSRRSGRGNRLTGQVGEYLVAAELARRGLIATTFAGNVPHYDIVASDAEGRHVSVQVKASTGSSWQFSMDRFCRMSFRGNQQIVGKALPSPVRRLVVVMVMLGTTKQSDRYFVLRWTQLRDIAMRHHRAWLRSHGGKRPVNPKSLHTAVAVSSLLRFEDGWPVVSRCLL